MKFDFQKDMAALKAGDRSAFNLLMEDYYGWSDPQDVRSEEQDVTKQISARQDLDAVAGRLKSAQHKDTFWLLLNGASVKDIAFECDVSESRARALIADVRSVIEAQINQN